MLELALEGTGSQTLDNTDSLLTLDQLELTMAEPFKPWKSTKHQPRLLLDYLVLVYQKLLVQTIHIKGLSQPLLPLVNHLAFQSFN